MEKKSGFLETEEAVHLLLAELEELKSAVEFIDGTSDAASRVAKAAEAMTKKTAELVGSGTSVFKALQEAQVGERLQQLNETVNSAVAKSNSLSEQIADTEQRLNERHMAAESLLREADEKAAVLAIEVSKLKTRQIGLMVGVAVSVVLQIVVIVFLASG